MVTRSNKTATATAAETVAPTIETPEVTDERTSFFDTVRQYAALAGVELPSGRMLAAGVVVQLLTTVTTGYVATQIAGYLAVAVLMFSGSSFLATLVAAIAVIIGMIGAIIAGSRAGAWVAGGGAEKAVRNATGFITGFFKKSEPKAA